MSYPNTVFFFFSGTKSPVRNVSALPEGLRLRTCSPACDASSSVGGGGVIGTGGGLVSFGFENMPPINLPFAFYRLYIYILLQQNSPST
jgi:hypothetical protein